MQEVTCASPTACTSFAHHQVSTLQLQVACDHATLSQQQLCDLATHFQTPKVDDGLQQLNVSDADQHRSHLIAQLQHNQQVCKLEHSLAFVSEYLWDRSQPFDKRRISNAQQAISHAHLLSAKKWTRW
jgi:hypothetical protein